MEPLIYGLAGLLHDIGKFGQRADGKYKDSEYLSSTTKENIGQICKLTQAGWYSHQHVLWTKEFMEKNIQKFKNAGIALENETYNNLVNLASYHHVPATTNQGIITLADWWSSGLDRSDTAILERNPDWGKDKFRSIPLTSCFPTLNVKDKYGSNTNYVYPVAKFSTDRKIFPKQVHEVDNKADYKKLWEEFNEGFKNLPDGDASTFIYSIYHLLKLYTWYMPGSTMEYPDISLFEHLKITGAFAHCLASYFCENDNAYSTASSHRITINEGHFPVKLWCGDISGIQSFIYNITNKSAVKSLKGRSMYVQLLSETVANEMMEEAGVSIINMVYSAGGKFYILLPNTEKINKQIEGYLNQLEKNLWNKFKGALSVNVASLAFTMTKGNHNRLAVITHDNKEKAISAGELWKLLADKVSSQKRQKFKYTILNTYETLFKPQGAGGDTKVCAVTGIEVKENNRNILQHEDIEQGEYVDEINYISPQVREQIDLGKALVSHKYLAVSHKEYKDTLKIGNSTFWKILKEYNHAEQCKEKTWILTNWEDEINLIPKEGIEKTSALGFRLYGGSNVATKVKEGKLLNKSFEELIKTDESEDERLNKLAILRMDIDNLGELFMHGFIYKDKNGNTINKGSFSALATLSTQLDVFFSGYINCLRNKSTYKNNLNIIYSGGDDLFAVGKWDKVIEFAAEIRNDFRNYVCEREDMSVSGGIALVRPKFPIAKGAELAGEAEDTAKNYIDSTGHEKNAITVFGIAINWQREWEFVNTCKDDLVKWIKEDKISKGVLMRIFVWYDQYKRNVPEWQWQSAYSLARMAKNKDDPEQKKALDQIKNLIYSHQYESAGKIYQSISFDTFITACRWAELVLRNLKK